MCRQTFVKTSHSFELQIIWILVPQKIAWHTVDIYVYVIHGKHFIIGSHWKWHHIPSLQLLGGEKLPGFNSKKVLEADALMAEKIG